MLNYSVAELRSNILKNKTLRIYIAKKDTLFWCILFSLLKTKKVLKHWDPRDLGISIMLVIEI